MPVIFIIYFLLRIIASFWFSGDRYIDLGDQSTYRYWSALLADGGFNNFYGTAQFFPYPPVANYLLFVMGKMAGGNIYLYNVILRLPSIFGDMIIGLVLYKILRTKIPMMFYLLQPAVFFIGSVWGQLDGLMTALTFLSFYFVINKRVYLGFISLLLAFLIKPQTVPFIFPIAAAALSINGLRKTFLASLMVIFLFFILFYPFYINNIVSGPYLYFRETLRDFSPRFTSSAFNFWYLLYGGWKDNFPLIFGISARRWSRIIFIVILGICSFLSYKSNKIYYKSLAIALSGFAFFLFFTQVKERYLFAIIPFLGFYVFFNKNKTAVIMCLVFSLLFAINSIGFFVGWIYRGLWNSTFLSIFNIDKMIALGFLLIFLYYIKQLIWQKEI